jgi:hypothetical protein
LARPVAVVLVLNFFGFLMFIRSSFRKIVHHAGAGASAAQNRLGPDFGARARELTSRRQPAKLNAITNAFNPLLITPSSLKSIYIPSAPASHTRQDV